MRREQKISELKRLNKLYKENNAKLQSEAARYKKAFQTRDFLVEELKSDMAGQQQIDLMLRAYIVALVQDAGGEVSIEKNRISELIANLPHMQTLPTDTHYIIKVEKEEVIEDGKDVPEDVR